MSYLKKIIGSYAKLLFNIAFFCAIEEKFCPFPHLLSICRNFALISMFVVGRGCECNAILLHCDLRARIVSVLSNTRF